MEARSDAVSGMGFIARALAAAAGLAVVGGCGGGEGANPAPPGPLLGATPKVSCPGVDLTGQDFIMVSPQGTDSELCLPGYGPPCKTIAVGLSTAAFWKYRAVVVRHGLYPTSETINLNGGVNVYGSCLFDGETDRKYRTVIQASPAPGKPAISVSGFNPVVSGLVVIGADQTAGGASVAMTVANASVTLSRTVLVAGNGGPAAARTPPSASATALRAALDTCTTPGGAASNSLWGQVDFQSFDWVAGIGGAGTGGQDIGPGGVGGQQGGASIGLLLVNAGMTTTADQFNRIVAGFGGLGGAGQAGLSFGLGGGATSGGAGGNGGPSIGVASIHSPNTPSSASYAYANAPGGGGARGPAGVDPGQCSGDPGAPGVQGGSAPVYQYPIPSTLTTGESLAAGQSLYSPNLQFKLVMQGDSNLCLYSAGNRLWCSQTQGQGIYQAIMQSDGNMCMYETQGDVLPICSGSAGHPGARLTVQDSGHAQVVDVSGAVVWSVP